MSEVLYQKIGITVDRLAQDLLTRKEGERILPISEYQERFQVSRGTIQNGFSFLKESGAIRLVSRGHLGTFIEAIDYRRLQDCCFNKEMLGSMPLPYSICYQGMATALYQVLSPYAFNLVYVRGSEGRLKLLLSEVCQFTVCSRHAAEEAIRMGNDIEIAVDLGPGTYLTRHVLLFRDPEQKQITGGMRVAYDRSSLDHRHLTETVTAGIKSVAYVDVKAHQIIRAIRDGEIDAGVWNLDDILESGYTDLNVCPILNSSVTNTYTSAVLVIRRGDESISQLLKRHVCPDEITRIQRAVREERMPADY